MRIRDLSALLWDYKQSHRLSLPEGFSNFEALKIAWDKGVATSSSHFAHMQVEHPLQERTACHQAFRMLSELTACWSLISGVHHVSSMKCLKLVSLSRLSTRKSRRQRLSAQVKDLRMSDIPPLHAQYKSRAYRFSDAVSLDLI